MKKLYNIINKLLDEHKGGEIFFDNLDYVIRKEDFIIRDLFNMIPKNKQQYIVCSGKFGKYLYENINKLSTHNKSLIVLEGGLRLNKKVELDHIKDMIRENEYIFIDDSYYSGKTRRVIEEGIKNAGGKLTSIYVVYDGSPLRLKEVKSLYRYYDNEQEIC